MERAEEAKVTAGAVVQAVYAWVRINERGGFVERENLIDINELVLRMSPEEQRHFAESGQAPAWFMKAISGQMREEDDHA